MGRNLESFKEKRILITGATGQIGKIFCREFAKLGAIICASDIDDDRCKELAMSLDSSKHIGVGCDISDDKQVIALFSQIERELNGIDIVINNAGTAVFSSFVERTIDEFMHVMRVNVGGTFLCIQQAAKLMKKNDETGSIINIGSIHGVVSGDPRIYTDCSRNTSECYGASKAAVIHMTKYFAVHLAQDRIRVNAVSPGGIFNEQGNDFVKNYSNRTPLNRMGNPHELLSAVKYFASDESSYTTGQNLVVDGGWTSW
jgi:NAD(P)-dependent dehydrogenase (short-subunit alcohol dehydrogenase family)